VSNRRRRDAMANPQDLRQEEIKEAGVCVCKHPGHILGYKDGTKICNNCGLKYIKKKDDE